MLDSFPDTSGWNLYLSQVNEWQILEILEIQLYNLRKQALEVWKAIKYLKLLEKETTENIWSGLLGTLAIESDSSPRPACVA